MQVRAAVASFLLLTGGSALAEGHAIGLKAGALGLGVEYTHELTERIAVRAGINGSELGFDGEESGIDYDFDLVWDSLSVAVDFHPLTTALRVTGGILRNDNRLEAVSRSSGNITIGDETFTPAEVGTLTGRFGYDDTVLFAGVGWDWSKRKRVGMSLDVGVVNQGDPRIRLRATGTAFNDPAFLAELAAEEAQLAEEFDDLSLLPYLTLGLVVRF